MQIACNYRGLSSSREASKPHFPTFATLPSENLDFHQKSYFYQLRSYSPESLDPYFLGSPKSMEIQGNLLGRHLRGSKSVRGGRRGRPRRSRATKVDRRSAQDALRTDLASFWVDFGMISGGPKCSAHRQGRVAEHFCQNRLFSLRWPTFTRFSLSRGLSGSLLGSLWALFGAPWSLLGFPRGSPTALFCFLGVPFGVLWGALG